MSLIVILNLNSHFPWFFCITLYYLLSVLNVMGFSIQIIPYLADFWWPCSLHSVSLKAPWHARNKELIAVLLPKHLEGSRGPRACVMALTGPGDSTVTVTEPEGRLDAVVKRRARKTQAAQTPGHLWTDACCSHAGAYANTQRRHAWPSAAHAKWNGIILFLLRCDRNTQTHTHIKYTHTHTHNRVSPLGAPDSSALSFQSVSGSSKHPVQLLFLADCTCTT